MAGCHLVKVIYAFGLRRREAAILDVNDFSPDPKAAEFSQFRICRARWGQAMRGSPPRRRSALAVMPWSSSTLEEYLEQVRRHP